MRTTLLVIFVSLILLTSMMKTFAVTISELEEGKLVIILSGNQAFSLSSQEELLKLLDSIIKEDKEMGQKEDYTEQEYRQILATQITRIKQFVEKYPGSTSSISAKFFACRLCLGSLKKLERRAIEMLKEIEQQFPDTWQAKVSPLLRATLVYDDERSIPERERITNAYTLLKEKLPNIDIIIDTSDPEFKAYVTFNNLEYPLRLRASYLSAIASCEYNMGFPGAAKPVGFDTEWLLKAKDSYQKVVIEYPNTTYSIHANQMIDTIEALLKN